MSRARGFGIPLLVVSMAVALTPAGADAAVTRHASGPKTPAAANGRRPIQVGVVRGTEKHRGLKKGQVPPVEPPRLHPSTVAGHTARVRPHDGPPSGDAGPVATNLALLPGLAVGDTSMVVYFDAPETGWTQGTVALYASGDQSTVLHQGSFTFDAVGRCGAPAEFCWTLANSDGWGVSAGTSYAVTVTLTATDGSQQVSAFSPAAGPRALPVPPPVSAGQARSGGGSGASTGRTGAVPVLRGQGVNVATGVFTQHAVDAVVSSSYPIDISAERTYSSDDTTEGLLGTGWSFSYDANIAVAPDGTATFTAEDGTQTSYAKRADGGYAPPPGVRSTLAAQPAGGWLLTTPDQHKLTFAGNGKLQSLTDARGKGVTLTYGSKGWLSAITDAGGRAVTVTTQAPGRVTTLTLPDRRSICFTYSADRLASVRDADGDVTSYGYDANGRLATVTNSFGRVMLTVAYGTDGRVTSQTDVFGKVTSFGWDAGKQESTVTDPDGVVVKDGFRNNVLQYTRDANNDVTVFRFDARLNAQVVADPMGDQYEMGHDAGGNTTSSNLIGPGADQESASYDPNNNLLSRTNGQGSVGYKYNDYNQVISATDRGGRTTSYTYDDDTGLLTSVKDPLGNVTTFGYDAAGDRTSVTAPAGEKTTWAYDATGRVTCTVDPRGNVSGGDPRAYTTTEAYDGENRVRRQTDPLGHFQLWDYDQVGNLTARTDRNGFQSRYVYDKANRLVQAIDPDLRTTAHTYTDAGRTASTTDGVGDQTRYSYDIVGRLASVVAPRGTVKDADPGQFTTTYSYDFNGDRTAVSHPYPGGGTVTTQTRYDALHRPVATIDPLGHTTRYGYDILGDVTSVTDPLGNVRRSSYDGNGTLLTSTDPRGRTTTYGYDADGELTSSTSPLGEKTTYAYDADGRRTGQTSPRGNVAGADPAAFTTRYAYDPASNLTTVTDPLGAVTASTYDADNRITTTTDPNGHTTGYTYDNAGRLTRILGPDATKSTQATVNDYDHAGHLIDRTDPMGRVTRRTYDLAGRLTSTVNGLGQHVDYGYDPDGDVTQILTARATSAGAPADRAANTISIAYDILDRPTERDLGAGGAVFTIGYDGANNVTGLGDPSGQQTRGYDADNRLSTVTRGTDSYGYEYDPGGNVTHRTLPDGTARSATFDDDGRTATGTDPSGTTTYGYDADSDLIRTALPGGNVDNRSYDGAGRLTALSDLDPSGKVLSGYTLTRDKAGNPMRQDTTQAGVAHSDAYTYDPANRLTAMCYNTTSCGSAKSVLAFSYDLVGNRLTRSSTGAASYTEKYSYNAADELTSRSGGPDGTVNYSYDADGNQTRAGAASYAYSLDNHLTSASDGKTSTAYSYDGADNRLAAASTGATPGSVTYQWDVNNRLPMLIGEKNGSTSKGYSYHPNGNPLSQQTGGASSLFRADPYGNTADLTDTSGTVQRQYTMTDPFGGFTETTPGGGSAPDNRLQFQGQYNDPLSAAYNLRARDYAGNLGRFRSTDPVTQPTAMPAESRYAYGSNNPLMYTDPSGQWDWGLTAAIAGAVVLVAASVVLDATGVGAAGGVALDVAAEALVEGAVDAGVDAGADAAVDAATDAGVDAATDAGTDASADAASDTTADTLDTSGDDLSDPATDDAGNADTPDEPGQSATDETAPDETAPDETAPDETAPDETAADETTPDEAAPDETNPDEENPEESENNSCETPNSFAGDTPVTLTDGTEKPIDQVKKGDQVLAADPKTGLRSGRTVDHVIVHGGRHTVVEVGLADGTTISATDHHPFWDATSGTFTDAVDLHVGDQLREADGRTIAVTSLSSHSQNLTAYNLTVHGQHTYYAGRTGVLVHNAGGPGTDECGPEGESQDEEGCKEYDVVPYRPSNAPLENHHGLLDVWASKNIPGYVSRAADSPTIALSKGAHDATKSVYRDWLEEMTGRRVGGKVNWTDVPPREMQDLTERMFDAADVPDEARSNYYQALNRYVYDQDNESSC